MSRKVGGHKKRRTARPYPDTHRVSTLVVTRFRKRLSSAKGVLWCGKPHMAFEPSSGICFAASQISAGGVVVGGVRGLG